MNNLIFIFESIKYTKKEYSKMNAVKQNAAPKQNMSPLEALLQYKSSPGTPCTPEGIAESKKGQKRPIDDVENHENAENIKGAENAKPLTFKLNTNVAKNENGTTFWNRVGCGIAGADRVRGNADRVQEQAKKSKKIGKFPFPKF